jgi:hypothetical protein
MWHLPGRPGPSWKIANFLASITKEKGSTGIQVVALYVPGTGYALSGRGSGL